MSIKIYVGNLPYSVTDSILESNFAEFGTKPAAPKASGLSKWRLRKTLKLPSRR